MTLLPATFKLERYFDDYEFTTKYLLCCSDVEALHMADLVDMADEQCKELWQNLKLSYTEAKGNHLLRKKISTLHGVSEDEVLVLAPQEGIYIAMKCLVSYIQQKNDNKKIHVVAMFPAYQSLYENLKVFNCDISYWTAKESTDGWKFSTEELLTLITPDTRLLVVNFPHNPTGYIPLIDDWMKIIDICRSRNIFLFSDEMYRLSNNDGTPALPSASALYDQSISLFGMSKTFALPGLRLGWLATKNREVMKMMCSFKDYITICPPAPSEILSIIGLRNKDKLIKHTMDIINSNLEILDSFFSKNTDIFTWHRPKAGTTGYVKLKGWLVDIESGGASAFCNKLVKEKEVLLLPSSLYSDSDCYVRIGFGRKDMEECVNVLAQFIKEEKP